MSDAVTRLNALVAESNLSGVLQLRNNPSGLPSAWLDLDRPADFPPFACALRAAGGRHVTATIFRPDPRHAPGVHRVAYHLLLDGLPITVKVTLAPGDALPSITPIFVNADWDEREIMELSGIVVEGHPNPRRLFLDERIDAGVFDRYVPYSEFTNAARSDAVWEKVKQASQRKNPENPS